MTFFCQHKFGPVIGLKQKNSTHYINWLIDENEKKLSVRFSILFSVYDAPFY
jgi:hypothetical protein